MRALVLGPQRRPTLAAVARTLDLAGPVATITAGWQDREPDDAELDALLDGRSVNLQLHARWQDVLTRDPDYAAAEREHRAALREQRELYLIALDGVLRTLHEVARHGGDAAPAARADAEHVVRLVDERHLTRVCEARASFDAAARTAERAAVAGHRADVAEILGAASALVVAGGHVGELAARATAVRGARSGRLIAWSAGAMALTERVVLFHDPGPHDPGPHDAAPHESSHAEFLDSGLGWCAASWCSLTRAPAADGGPRRMAVLAFRAAPARCLVLDDAGALDSDPATSSPGCAGRDGSTGAASLAKRKLAINRLRDRKALDDATVDRFLARNEVPIVEGRALHVPVPRRRRRGPARAARGGAARADPDAQAAGHRPVVPRSRAARGLPGQLPARGTPRRARRAVQRPAQPQALLQPRGHVLGVFRRTATRPRSGPSPTRRHDRARSRRSWCRVGRCGATAR